MNPRFVFMTLEEIVDPMSREERSLLLYLETRAVEKRGIVASSHMNKEEIAIAMGWAEVGFIRFARMKAEFLEEESIGDHVVELSDIAWRCAALERRRRAARCIHKEIVFASLEHHEKNRRKK